MTSVSTVRLAVPKDGCGIDIKDMQASVGQ